MNIGIFGEGDVVVKYVLECHDHGVNQVAAFDPSLPLIVLRADGHQAD